MDVALNRWLHRVAYQVLRVWWFVARPTTHGVKLVLWDGDRVLFVRHAYGDRAVWELPGGGRKRRETPHEAARREGREELGIDVSTWAIFGRIEATEHATAHLECLTATHDGAALVPNLGELEETRWCTVTAPPRPLGKHAASIIALATFPTSPERA